LIGDNKAEMRKRIIGQQGNGLLLYTFDFFTGGVRRKKNKSKKNKSKRKY